ncbi:MAG: hypothetical protein A2W35_06695 [Chloroflexi bacterium RBG_16_57_11]|nr:MAG: hypothetical protein A2W35_06695 [Chloroflexi bacterium RBG_16_57_11]
MKTAPPIEEGKDAIEYMTVAEVAQMLRVKEATVCDWLRCGFMMGTRIGKQWLIPKPLKTRTVLNGKIVWNNVGDLT